MPAPGHKVDRCLLRNLAVTMPNQAWAIDITFISTAHGFVDRAKIRHILLSQKHNLLRATALSG